MGSQVYNRNSFGFKSPITHTLVGHVNRYFYNLGFVRQFIFRYAQVRVS